MKARLLAALALPLAAASTAPAAEFKLQGHTFTLPDGFSIELAAGNDLVPRPIAGSFDPQGRLYVTDSSGSNKPPAEQLKDPQSRILRLEDTDGDGRFDRSSVYADKVMFPQGCLWHDGSVYVAGPPSIWKFTDGDGDGVAERREEWYQGKVLTGCANDVHGPYLGPEGLLYWTKGAFARLDLKDHRGRPINDRCAHVFRARADGSGLETVMSGGMDNPVEVAFTATGEPVIISTFIDLSQPGRRDGLAHAVYGGVFGKINDVVDEPMVRRTGELLPAMTHYGPAAACALMRYEGDAFGAEFRDNLFGTLFNLRKVTRHVLQPKGASYVTEDSDFLVSDQIDFRPTDVLQDVDGSLLVVDTGGWYKLCCPSSQLAKADVLGGIYRITRTGTPRMTPAARRDAYPRLTRPPGLRDDLPEVKAKRAALAAKVDAAGEFRTILAEHGPRASTSDASARLARVAAEGLGRIGDRESVPLLLRTLAASTAEDRFLEHSLLYALIEIGSIDALRPHLGSADPVVRRAALLALEQIEGGSALIAPEIAPSLTASDARLKETAQWIVRRHPEWAPNLVRHFRSRLSSTETPAAEKTSWEGLLGLLSRDQAGQAFLAEIVAGPGFRPESTVAALDAMAKAAPKDPAALWRQTVRDALAKVARPDSESRPEVASAILRAVRALPQPREGDPAITGLLLAVARHPRLSDGLKLEALAALPNGSPAGDDEVGLLVRLLEPGRPPGERLAAASATSRLKFGPSQLERFVAPLATAGPLELPRLLSAFAPGGDARLGESLLTALASSKALRSLRPEDLKPALAAFPTEIQSGAERLLQSVATDASQDRVRLDLLLGELQKLDGQIRRGQTLFNSPKAACSSCHRLGYLGGDVGPDLTNIGTIRTERDLLEALVYPSASLVRSYEPWIATTKDGEEYSGVLRRDTPDEIVLATGPGAEIRIARRDLTELRLGALSTMPAGLDEQLSKQDLADLLAFLKNTKWGAN